MRDSRREDSTARQTGDTARLERGKRAVINYVSRCFAPADMYIE
jgi:hypothetical protein